MKKVQVVIGANWGDEGKGLMTDYLSSIAKGSTIVTRFNGGPQSGHTVETPTGQFHIFSHFGSGTMCGVPTYLSKFFIVNPVMFSSEYNKLESLGYSPKVYIDPECIVTTPWDMMINQIFETSKTKHGSCGLGINETIKRNEHDMFSFKFKDLFDSEMVILKLNKIKRFYFSKRLRDLGVDSIPLNFVDYLSSEKIFENYMEDVKFLLENAISLPINLKAFENIIFEGAQGLALDQNNLDDFPHLTPSNTGMQNVIKILKDSNLDFNEINLEAYYMTRKYATRHGEGPFEAEDESLYTACRTNLKNDFQGRIKYGKLDLDGMFKRINKDVSFVDQKLASFKKTLVMTHMDQEYPKVDNAKLIDLSEKYEFERLRSNGPTRNHIY